MALAREHPRTGEFYGALGDPNPGSGPVRSKAELHVSPSDRNGSVGSTLEDVERDYILRTLRESCGGIAGVHGAAARLGMKRTTLQSRMQKLGITREEYET